MMTKKSNRLAELLLELRDGCGWDYVTFVDAKIDEQWEKFNAGKLTQEQLDSQPNPTQLLLKALLRDVARKDVDDYSRRLMKEALEELRRSL